MLPSSVPSSLSGPGARARHDPGLLPRRSPDHSAGVDRPGYTGQTTGASPDPCRCRITIRSHVARRESRQGSSAGRAARPATTADPPEPNSTGRSTALAPRHPGTHQAILPKATPPGAVQPYAGEAFSLPPNFTLKPRGSGQPLPEPVQKKMESFFKASFADVRIHVGHEAPTIGALAFTHGNDLYFAPGQYNPHSTQGQQLLGHELTHVLQQRAGRVRNPLGAGVAVVQDPALEAEAERMGLRAASASVPVQAKPAAINPVVSTLAEAISRPTTVATNGAMCPAIAGPRPRSAKSRPHPANKAIGPTDEHILATPDRSIGPGQR